MRHVAHLLHVDAFDDEPRPVAEMSFVTVEPIAPEREGQGDLAASSPAGAWAIL